MSKEIVEEHKLSDLNKPEVDRGLLENIFGTANNPKTNKDVHFITNEKDTTSQNNNNHNVHKNGDAEPLLEADKGKPVPPLAGPESDLDDHAVSHLAPYPGIDDGLLDHDNKSHHEHDNHDDHSHELDKPHLHEDGVGTDDVSMNGIESRFGEDRPTSPAFTGIPPDANTYQQKKNLAQGMMDLALLSANANQLRYVIESGSAHPYFIPSLAFISISIVFQIAVGVGLIMNSQLDVKDEKEVCRADKINDFTVLGVFLVTIVNVFITAFSVASPTAGVAVAVPPPG